MFPLKFYHEAWLFHQHYIRADKEMLSLLKQPANKAAMLVHTLINAILLNTGIAIATYDVPGFAIFPVILDAVTFFSILLIEAAIYTAARRSGGSGEFWQQLRITNIYLTPLFAIFAVAFIILSLVKLPDIKLGLDLIAFVIVLYANDKKIRAVHGINNTSLPMVVYTVTTFIAYTVWILVLMSPLIFTLLFASG
ncbi:MAG: hypothetical protein QW112_01355 [Candidatus Micrarchaeia archaeon]